MAQPFLYPNFIGTGGLISVALTACSVDPSRRNQRDAMSHETMIDASYSIDATEHLPSGHALSNRTHRVIERRVMWIEREQFFKGA
jgi:hypothetical protein